MIKTLFKVKCIRSYGSQFAGTEPIIGNLSVGEIYKVEKIKQHSWHTKYLIEKKWYNSVNFEKIYKYKIAIDIDGVLANTVEAILPAINSKYNKNLKYEDIKQYNFTIEDINIGKIILNDLEINKQFALSIKPYAYISKIMNTLYTNNIITILTSRSPESDTTTKIWLEEHKIPYDYFMNSFNKSKKDYKWDILIDDYIGNFYLLEPNRIGILINQPWNENCNLQDNIYRTENLLEAYEIIKNLSKIKK